jgi:hypothetical protein
MLKNFQGPFKIKSRVNKVLISGVTFPNQGLFIGRSLLGHNSAYGRLSKGNNNKIITLNLSMIKV